MKNKSASFYLINFALIGCLIMTGCLSNSRNWFSFKKTGENASLAASGTEARISAEHTLKVQRQITELSEEIREDAQDIQKHNEKVEKTITKDAPQIIPKTHVHTQAIKNLSVDVEAKSKGIEKSSKSQEKWIKKFRDFSDDVVKISKGEKQWPMALIVLVWLLGIAIALTLINKAIPLRIILTPFANIFAAIITITTNVISGEWKQEQDLKYEHWDKTQTIKNEEMPEKVQYKILKHKVKKNMTTSHAQETHTSSNKKLED